MNKTIKMKSLDLKSSIYINFNNENKKEDPKFKAGNNVKISKYKNIFAKGYVPNWYDEVFLIKKVKNTVPWTYNINDFNREEIVGLLELLTKKNCKKQIKKSLAWKNYYVK